MQKNHLVKTKKVYAQLLVQTNITRRPAATERAKRGGDGIVRDRDEHDKDDKTVTHILENV